MSRSDGPRCGGRRPPGEAWPALCPSCLLATALATGPDREESSSDLDPSPYHIVTLLARDANAVTYLAHRPGTPEHIALKVIAGCDAAAIVARFDDWKTALACARHPNIARLIDVGHATGGGVYVVSEYVTGPSLDLLARRGTLATAERLEIVRQVACALEDMHTRGLAHMKLHVSRIKIAMTAGIHVTLLGFGTRLIVDGAAPQPDLDVRMLTEMCGDLGVDLPPPPPLTMAAIRAALADGV
jgi:serine/threonine protein kinase